MKLRNRIMEFMRGRYGFGYGSADRINIFLIVLYLIFGILNSIVRNIVFTYIFSFASLASVGYLLFRIFSRNIPARRRENDIFVRFLRSFTGFFKYNWRKLRDIAKARYRKCPHCSATLRLPVKRGSHTVVCPACKQRFSVRILF